MQPAPARLRRRPRSASWQRLRDFLSLTGPAGGRVEFAGASPHPILQTVRVPLSAFGGVALANLRGVRFTFDDTNHDEIFIGNIRCLRPRPPRLRHPHRCPPAPMTR
jgi:hypothetical protein